jgi:hypothetical protein
MTHALERVRTAIIEGTSLSIDDVDELTVSMPVELQDGLMRLIAGVVATYHSNGGASVSDWMGESVESHLEHAFTHSGYSYQRDGDGNYCGMGICEDGLLHLDHAACRIAMAFAREMMVKSERQP